MTNGEYESKYQKDVIKQLKVLNALLLEHMDHIIAMRAMLDVIMIYLPAALTRERPQRRP